MVLRSPQERALQCYQHNEGFIDLGLNFRVELGGLDALGYGELYGLSWARRALWAAMGEKMGFEN